MNINRVELEYDWLAPKLSSGERLALDRIMSEYRALKENFDKVAANITSSPAKVVEESAIVGKALRRLDTYQQKALPALEHIDDAWNTGNDAKSRYAHEVRAALAGVKK